MTIRRLSFTDRLISTAQQAITLSTSRPQGARPTPEPPGNGAVSDAVTTEMSATERRHAAALMRVNHVGEVCAQALYQGQGLMARDPRVCAQFELAAREEIDHLAWTAERLSELNDRPSPLNPAWYLGSLVIGMLAGARNDSYSLGFMAETERQVEQHLDGHLSTLPATDLRSRAIVAQMKQDEASHAATALDMGGIRPPWAVRQTMRGVAKLMTTVSYRI